MEAAYLAQGIPVREAAAEEIMDQAPAPDQGTEAETAAAVLTQAAPDLETEAEPVEIAAPAQVPDREIKVSPAETAELALVPAAAQAPAEPLIQSRVLRSRKTHVL